MCEKYQLRFAAAKIKDGEMGTGEFFTQTRRVVVNSIISRNPRYKRHSRLRRGLGDKSE